MKILGTYIGKAGSATKYVDDQKAELCVGDVVLVSSGNNKDIALSCVICLPNDTPTIMGIESVCNHETGEIMEDWKILRLLSGKDLHHVIRIGLIPVDYE